MRFIKMQQSLIKIIALAVLVELVKSREINITIMVPGIKAFQNIYKDVKALNSSSPIFLYDGQLMSDQSALEDSTDPTQAAYELSGNDDLSTCINEVTLEVDAACVRYMKRYNTYPWSYMLAKPALDVALETIKQTEGLLDGFEIKLRYYDSGDDLGKASARLAQITAVDSMMRDHMTAMIGPMNSFAMSRVASFTSHWRKLSFTPASISYVLRDLMVKEKLKNTLVRSGPVASQLGDCLVALLDFYNWTSTAVQVFEDDSGERYHYFISEGAFASITKFFPQHETNQVRLSEYAFMGDPDGPLYQYDAVMEQIRTQGRVVIISAESDITLQLMTYANIYGHNGDYAYVIIDLEDKLGLTPWIYEDQNGTKVVDEDIRRMLRTALIVTLPKDRNRKYDNFVYSLTQKLGSDLFEGSDDNLGRKIVHQLVADERYRYGAESIEEYFQKNQYPAYLHDSLLMLAHVLNSSLTGNTTLDLFGERDPITNAWGSPSHHNYGPFPDGAKLMEQHIINKEFHGLTGKMAFDGKGDRKFDFSILHLDKDADEFREIGRYDSRRETYHEHTTAYWPGGTPPPDVPKCGFDGSKCSKPEISLIECIVILTGAIVCIVAVVSFNAYRHFKLRKELESQLWRVNWSDITWSVSPNSILGGTLNGNLGLGEPRASESEPSLGEVMSYFVPSLSPAIAAKRAHKRKRKWSSNSRKNDRIYDNERKTSAGSLISDKVWGGLTTIGLYKDKTVVLKLTNRRKVELTRDVLMELKHMRDVTHEHLTRFDGACLEWPHICVLTEYCRKGSLKDILLNEEITMDWMFRVSLMNDLVKGMCFLHQSAIQCHGNLKSTNCVVDSRFVLKITDYGLQSFRSLPSMDDSERECEKKLWTAPELLRCASNNPLRTQKADVYSFGIILQEIALRRGPFYVGGMPPSCREIIAKVRYGFQPYFRPMMDLSVLSEDICNLMQKCWHEDPNERPDFNLTKKIIERFNRENPGNLVENLLHRMEQYAINLEGLVEERTAAYMEEKQKADDLLYQMLPVPVVDRLKRGDAVPAEAFESVTICFTDIVGFTSLSAASSPMEIVSFLNELYTCFDAIIDNFDVYKVETIGDAYMLVSGLPVRNGISHAGEIARTALALLKAVSNFKIRHRPGDQLKLRIGIHTGPCCAGVVGLKMPRYCLFGDTVNTASRMESSGMPLAIHVSDSTKQLLDKYQSFQLQLRGDVPMKGKGALTTYWLLDEIAYDQQSLDEDESRI